MAGQSSQISVKESIAAQERCQQSGNHSQTHGHSQNKCPPSHNAASISEHGSIRKQKKTHKEM